MAGALAGAGLGIPHLPAGSPSSSGKAMCQQVCGKGRQQSPSYNKSWRCLQHSATSKGGEQEFSEMSINMVWSFKLWVWTVALSFAKLAALDDVFYSLNWLSILQECCED